MVQEKDGNHKFLIIRKVARTLKESVYELAKSLLKETGFDKFCRFKFSQGDNYIEFLPNGNKMIFLGLDDPEKIKSIAGVTGIFIEEATELEERDFLQLDLRLRGITNRYLQIIIAFNPVSSDHWLVRHVEPQVYRGENPPDINPQYLTEDRKVWEFETSGPNGVVLCTRTINTTYEDNRFLDDQYTARLETLAAVDDVYYTVYKLGRWGRIIDGTQYATNFKESQHVFDLSKLLNKDKPIHYAVDFNVTPYMSGLVIQHEYIQGKEWNGHKTWHRIRIFKENALRGNSANARDLGAAVVNDLTLTAPLSQGLILYGDASGMNRLGTKDTKNLFHDLERGFGSMRFAATKRIPSSNPRYKRIAPKSLGRRAFLNLLLSGKLPVKIEIDRSCHELIHDCKYCTTDANGAKEKKKVKGIEPRGHMLDALEYFACHPKTLGFLAIIS